MATCDPTKAELKIEGGPSVFTLHVNPHPDLPPGLASFDIIANPRHAMEELPPSQWKMRVMVHQLVEPVPSTVNFGALTRGQTATQTVTLMSRDGVLFTVESWKSSNANTVVEPLASTLGDVKHHKAFKLTQLIADLGSQQSTIVFSVRTNDLKDLEITCPVRYHGLPQVTTKR